MAYQQYIKNSFLDDLKGQIKEGKGLELYFEEDFPIPEDMVQVIPQIKLPEGLCERMDPKNELSSAIELYRAYKNLSPIQATDTYFWESLAHTNLFRYVKQRWPISPDTITPDYILQHWFVSSSANVSRHSLASLWWPVYLAIDEDLDNPFELTEVLFRNQTFRTRTYGTSLIFPIKEANMGSCATSAASDDCAMRASTTSPPSSAPPRPGSSANTSKTNRRITINRLKIKAPESLDLRGRGKVANFATWYAHTRVH